MKKKKLVVVLGHALHLLLEGVVLRERLKPFEHGRGLQLLERRLRPRAGETAPIVSPRHLDMYRLKAHCCNRAGNQYGC